MSATNQITGGAFQDAAGNPLANGYLQFELNVDGIVNTNVLVCSQYTVTVPLDVNGNVVVNPVNSLWPNDVITPSGTFYKVSAFSSEGVLVWGPNSQQILSTPSPFVLGVLIPGDA